MTQVISSRYIDVVVAACKIREEERIWELKGIPTSPTALLITLVSVPPRLNWDPRPLSRKRVCPLPGTKGEGGHTRLRGGGVPFPTTGGKA
jgi:hypothetical protein